MPNSTISQTDQVDQVDLNDPQVRQAMNDAQIMGAMHGSSYGSASGAVGQFVDYFMNEHISFPRHMSRWILAPQYGAYVLGEALSDTYITNNPYFNKAVGAVGAIVSSPLTAVASVCMGAIGAYYFFNPTVTTTYPYRTTTGVSGDE